MTWGWIEMQLPFLRHYLSLSVCIPFKQVVAKYRSQDVQCAVELRKELESSRLSAQAALQGFEGEFRQLQQELLHDVADLKERILTMKANIRGTLKTLDFPVEDSNLDSSDSPTS